MKTITIEEAVKNFKELVESSIIMGGDKAKTAMIRSSKPILNIHDAVKSELILNGVNENLIFPHLFERTPELKLAGALKKKDQDVCIVPNDLEQKKEILDRGLLQGTEDLFGKRFTEKTLTINVRSQISSIQKNFDTLYERTISEAQNLHDRCSNMVLGEVYLLAVPEYDDSEFKNNNCIFKDVNKNLVEKYIKSFQAITNRKDSSDYSYLYESTCLLIVDFRNDVPKIYNSTEELKSDGLLPSDSEISYEGLCWNDFITKILKVYKERFGSDKLI